MTARSQARSPRTRLGAVGAVLAVLASLVISVPAASAVSAPLTNLAHLDFLTDRVAPPAQPGHTTFRLQDQPWVGVLWTYADARDGGTFERTGGGPYDEASNTYGQGAYNADDLARAAVVYLRHWRQYGDDHSRAQAYELLRGLTYLQTATGPDAGNPHGVGTRRGLLGVRR